MDEPRVTAVCLGRVKGDLAKERVLEADVEQFGLAGDRHARAFRTVQHGKLKGQTVFNERQWSAVSEEEVALLEQRLGISIPVGALGENFRVAGIAVLSKLPRGTALHLSSGVVLAVAEENEPCRNAAAFLAAISGVTAVERQFVRAAYGLRGLVGWVELPGMVREGDSVRVEAPSNAMPLVDRH